MRKLNEIAASDRNQRQLASPNGSNGAGGNAMKISSVAKLKSYSIRMIKALKEDLAKIQNEYIARVNANIDQYLSGKEQVKLMGED